MIEYVHAIEGIISVTMLAAFVYGPLQWVCTDAARQRLFFLRDQLFDLARVGKLDFASDDYRIIRGAFDRQIRFAHMLDFMRFVILSHAAKQLKQVPRSIDDAISRIEDGATRMEVERLVSEMNLTMILMILGKTPLLWFLCLVGLIVKLLSSGEDRKLVLRKVGVSTGFTNQAFPGWIMRFVGHLAPLIHEEAAGLVS